MKRHLYNLLFSALILLIFSSVIKAQSGPCGLSPITSGSEINGRVLFNYNNLLFTVRDAEVYVLANGRGVVGTKTDENGRFNLKGIKPGKYTITVDAFQTLRLEVKLNAIAQLPDLAQDNLVELVLGAKEQEKCNGGYVQIVKSYNDKNVFGGSASDEEEQITEISLEHTGCFGSCPRYKVTFRKVGTAIYVGKDFVSRKGTYRGKFDGYPFISLARLIYRSGFFNMKDRYRASFTDLDTMIVSVVRNGKRVTVENYGGVAPIELWGIAMAIDAATEDIKWVK